MTPITDDKLAELRECPFCGGEASIIEGEESAYVQCQSMKMHRALWFDGDNDAANVVREQWNRRASDARISAYEEALEPFAKAADHIERDYGLDTPDRQMQFPLITMGELRRARNLLRKEETE